MLPQRDLQLPIHPSFPVVVPPPDPDPVLYNGSNQFAARSQLLHRLSTHSNSSSSNSRRGSSRVGKLSSAGNSPHYVQRRRTTTSYTSSRPLRMAQDNPYQTREQRLWNYYNARGAFSEPRPMSWHPGSDLVPHQAAESAVSEPAFGHTIAGFENLAVSGKSAPSLQQSIENAFAMGYGYPTGNLPSTVDATASEVHGYSSSGTASQFPYSSYSAYGTPDHSQTTYMTQAPVYDTLPPENFHTFQWPQAGLDHPGNAHDTYPSAALNQTTANVQYLNIKELPHTPKKESDELVGIGLYDDADHNKMSARTSAYSAPVSLRKDLNLRLEETWQPPTESGVEADGNDGRDSSSSEEGDDAEEDLPVIDTTLVDAQPAFYPTYDDLSNRSFFFNDDEAYLGESAFIAIDQGLQHSQAKAQVADTQNFLWL